MQQPYSLLRHLADGRFHSGEELARAAGVSRAAVWKQLQRLQQLPGLQVHAVRGRGYRLAAPIELLDEGKITPHLEARHTPLINIDLFNETDSTNAYLLRQGPPDAGTGHACLAELQTAGRGRRGRNWVGGFGQGLTLSLAWSFDLPMAALGGFSLAAGVQITNALDAAGIQGLGLKWPNDIYLDGSKLAGILIEASGESTGPTRVVIGVGINLAMDAESAAVIDQPWADLRSQWGVNPPRNRLAGQLLSALIEACLRYAEQGLAPFLLDWQRYDLFFDQQVEVHQGNQIASGRYVGLTAEGQLVLETVAGRKAFSGGEVSLRPRSQP